MENFTVVQPIEHWYTNRDWTVPYLISLLVVGTLGNTCGIVLFINVSMRQYSCSLYFLLLSIFDEISLSSWIVNRSTLLCESFVVVFYTSSQASTGMLVLAMIDRLYTSRKIARGYVDVRWYIRQRRFRYISLLIFFLILIACNAVLFGSQLVDVPDDEESYCLIVNVAVTRIYSLIDLCIYALIPASLMLIGDILILYYIRQTRARIVSLNTRSKRRERQLSLMLVVASIVSLFIISPYSLLKLLVNFSEILDDDYRTLHTLNDAFGLLSTLTHAMHFYLFLIISGTMRKHFKILLWTIKNKCLKRRTTNSIQPFVVPSMKTISSSQPTVFALQQPIPVRRKLTMYL